MDRLRPQSTEAYRPHLRIMSLNNRMEYIDYHEMTILLIDPYQNIKTNLNMVMYVPPH